MWQCSEYPPITFRVGTTREYARREGDCRTHSGPGVGETRYSGQRAWGLPFGRYARTERRPVPQCDGGNWERGFTNGRIQKGPLNKYEAPTGWRNGSEFSVWRFERYSVAAALVEWRRSGVPDFISASPPSPKTVYSQPRSLPSPATDLFPGRPDRLSLYRQPPRHSRGTVRSDRY